VQFKAHASISHVKISLNGRASGPTRSHVVNGVNVYEAPLEESWVYEWVVDDLGEGWVERFHINVGDFKSSHPLWLFKEKPRQVRPVSQEALDQTIASIQEAMGASQ